MINIEIEEQNHKAYKYQETISDRIVDVCKPLANSLGVPHFSYTCFYHDGSYYSSKNNLDFQKDYFLNLNSNALTWGDCIGAGPDGLETMLWPQKPQIEPMKFVHRRGLWNGISFSKKGKNRVENWCFVGDLSSTELQSFLLRNLPALKMFIEYFNVKTFDIISKNVQSKQNLARFKNGFILNENKRIEEIEKVNKFLKDIRTTFHPLKSQKITKMENKCLYHLSRGNTVKQIANVLGISARTVETYMNNVKQKTRYRLRS